MNEFKTYQCAKCGAPLIPSTSGRYSMCSDFHCVGKLIDRRLPVKVAKRHLAIVNCNAVDATFDPYSQCWKLDGDPDRWDIVDKINNKLYVFPADVPKSHRIGLVDGTTPASFKRKGAK